MGLVFEEVSKGVMPEAPKLISDKKLTDWVKDSDGDLNNGNGYKKEKIGNDTIVYDGKFKKEVFQKGTIYVYSEGYYSIIQTDKPFTKNGDYLVFSENTVSETYYSEVIGETIIGPQKLQIKSYGLWVLPNSKIEFWYFDFAEFVLYYKGNTTSNKESKDNILMTSDGDKYVGTFTNSNGDLLDSFYDVSNPLDFTDGKTTIPNIINYIIS